MTGAPESGVGSTREATEAITPTYLEKILPEMSAYSNESLSLEDVDRSFVKLTDYYRDGLQLHLGPAASILSRLISSDVKLKPVQKVVVDALMTQPNVREEVTGGLLVDIADIDPDTFKEGLAVTLDSTSQVEDETNSFYEHQLFRFIHGDIEEHLPEQTYDYLRRHPLGQRRVNIAIKALSDQTGLSLKQINSPETSILRDNIRAGIAQQLKQARLQEYFNQIKDDTEEANLLRERLRALFEAEQYERMLNQMVTTQEVARVKEGKPTKIKPSQRSRRSFLSMMGDAAIATGIAANAGLVGVKLIQRNPENSVDPVPRTNLENKQIKPGLEVYLDDGRSDRKYVVAKQSSIEPFYFHLLDLETKRILEVPMTVDRLVTNRPDPVQQGEHVYFDDGDASKLNGFTVANLKKDSAELVDAQGQTSEAPLDRLTRHKPIDITNYKPYLVRESGQILMTRIVDVDSNGDYLLISIDPQTGRDLDKNIITASGAELRRDPNPYGSRGWINVPDNQMRDFRLKFNIR